jgi:competence protein ComEC
VVLSGNLEERVVNQWHSRFSLMYPDVQLLRSDSSIINVLKWRKKIEAVYNQVLPEPEASLLAGIVLGVRRSLPKKFWQALQETGTLHIVVASGYNVTVVIGTVIFLLAGWVKRRAAVVLGIMAVVIYTLMAGGGPAIVRAAIMGSLAYFGQVLGRKADGARLLIVAAGLMLLIKPELVWDIGFQLSVMATGGLLLIGNELGRVFYRFGEIGKIMSETLAAQIGVWPILVINFGQMSVFAVLVNSLILWLVPIIMGMGVVLAGVGWLNIGLAKVAGWLVYVPLSWMVRTIEWFGKQGWISWQVDKIDWWWGLGYYLVLGMIWLRIKMRKELSNSLSEGKINQQV